GCPILAQRNIPGWLFHIRPSRDSLAIPAKAEIQRPAWITCRARTSLAFARMTGLSVAFQPGRALFPSAFDAHGDAHAAANAQRRETLLRAAPPHFVEQRGEDARARGADGVPDGDSAAIDVHL